MHENYSKFRIFPLFNIFPLINSLKNNLSSDLLINRAQLLKNTINLCLIFSLSKILKSENNRKIKLDLQFDILKSDFFLF